MKELAKEGDSMADYKDRDKKIDLSQGGITSRFSLGKNETFFSKVGGIGKLNCLMIC